jgi:non-ribosomal peptide synthetase-like protein
VPPADPSDACRADSAWLGSPAVFLPQRQKSAGFSDETTFHPNWKLRAQRAAIEFFRVLTPSTSFIILISLLFSALLLLKDFFGGESPMLYSIFSESQVAWFGRHETLMSLACFPFLYIACGLAATLITLAAKWILVWRYRPGEKPLWSTAVWRNELINALHEHLAEPFFVGALTGTPFLSWYFRALGAKIGRRAYVETTDLSEFDLVRIGDEAALNADCTIQTHLFEDRVMKMSNINIGPRANIGAGTLVLYDTVLAEGAALGDLSLLMKGETLPARSRWQGIPAQPAK